ncbi:hypothetical protein MTO96_039329, partial [Rhipicephalus appendiculatus]
MDTAAGNDDIPMNPARVSPVPTKSRPPGSHPTRSTTTTDTWTIDSSTVQYFDVDYSATEYSTADIPTQPRTPATPSSAKPPTASTSPPRPTTTLSPSPPTAPSTTTAKPVAMAVPPDGVCDYMFFDSLYTNSTYTLIDSAPSGELEVYLRAAKSSQKTEHGVGFNFRYVYGAYGDLTNRGADSKNFLGTLLSQKILGFGVLSINKLQFTNALYHGAVSLLMAVKAFILRELGRSDIFTVVGIFIMGTKTANALANTFRAIGGPDVYIGLGHIAYPNNNMTDCQMIPLSVYKNDTKANELRAKYGSLYSF